MSRPAIWIPLLALAALFFGWESYKAWTGPVVPDLSPPPAEAFSPRETAVPEGDTPAGVPAYSIASIVARPLFRPDRRPYQENSAVLPARNYEAELSRITLLGVLLLGERRMAVVTDGTPGRSDSREVAAGDTLPGFTVKEIRTDGVLLEADGRTFLLPLFSGGPKSGGTTAVRTETAPPRPPVAQRPTSAPSPRGGAGAPLPARVPPAYPGPGDGVRRMHVPGK